jgi:hypothetical protein
MKGCDIFCFTLSSMKFVYIIFNIYFLLLCDHKVSSVPKTNLLMLFTEIVQFSLSIMPNTHTHTHSMGRVSSLYLLNKV